jgi:hypothetical protein
MATYTNNLGLPKAMFDALTLDNHVSQGSDFGVTTLLSPPRLQALLAEHRHEIEEDAADRVWLLFGSAVHIVLERAAEADDESV